MGLDFIFQKSLKLSSSLHNINVILKQKKGILPLLILNIWNTSFVHITNTGEDELEPIAVFRLRK